MRLCRRRRRDRRIGDGWWIGGREPTPRKHELRCMRDSGNARLSGSATPALNPDSGAPANKQGCCLRRHESANAHRMGLTRRVSRVSSPWLETTRRRGRRSGRTCGSAAQWSYRTPYARHAWRRPAWFTSQVSAAGTGRGRSASCVPRHTARRRARPAGASVCLQLPPLQIDNLQRQRLASCRYQACLPTGYRGGRSGHSGWAAYRLLVQVAQLTCPGELVECAIRTVELRPRPAATSPLGAEVVRAARQFQAESTCDQADDRQFAPHRRLSVVKLLFGPTDRRGFWPWLGVSGLS
jgi:hypothetical protein